MSLFCSSLPSTSGSLLSKVASRQLLPFLYPREKSYTTKSSPNSRVRRRRSSRLLSSSPSTFNLEEWFFDAIAKAGQGQGYCHKNRLTSQKAPSFFTSRRPAVPVKDQLIQNAANRRQGHNRAAVQHPADNTLPERERSREELLALIDQYSGTTFTDVLPLAEFPMLYQPSDGGPPILLADQKDYDGRAAQHTWPADPDTKIKLGVLKEALEDWSNTVEYIFELYRELPKPRAPYLDPPTRHSFLRFLSFVERKDETSMLRYMSVVDDMKEAEVPLNVAEWNTALSFISRYVTRSTEAEVEAALTMWNEMEHVVGVKSNNATFNILFDVACKAGKFNLAEMIYKEMTRRGMQFDRYHHVSKIFYYGLKKSGDGARIAYKELIEAGEIVDTTVLNAMISALFRSNEAQAAENVYERMKKAHWDRVQAERKLQPRDFKDRRAIRARLKRWARLAQRNPASREAFQRKSIIAPDLRTFRILVYHFSVEAGDLDKTAKILEEMAFYELPVHGTLFLALFQGFAKHGGIRYTHWTEDRLEMVWKSLLDSLDAKIEGLYISRWMVTWTLRAFAKCSGKPRCVAVWDDIRSRWDPSEDDREFVKENLRQILDGPDLAVSRDSWVLGSM